MSVKPWIVRFFISKKPAATPLAYTQVLGVMIDIFQKSLNELYFTEVLTKFLVKYGFKLRTKLEYDHKRISEVLLYCMNRHRPLVFPSNHVHL